MQNFIDNVRNAKNDNDLQVVIDQIEPVNYELHRVLGDVFWYEGLETLDKKKNFMTRRIEFYLGERKQVGEFELAIFSSVPVDHVVLDSIAKAADANEMGKKLRVKLAGKEEESHCFMVADELGNTFFIDEESLSIF